MRPKILLILTFVLVYTCDDIIEVVDISNETVTTLAPANEVTLTENDISFTWEAVEDAENYKIQIATPDFVNATKIVADSVVAGTLFNKVLVSGNYEWRVRAENSAYATAFKAQAFVVDSDVVDISDEIVTISAPNNGATFSTTDTVDFSWEAVQGANQYVVQIVTPDFENPTKTIKDEIVTSTNLSVSNLDENSYEFRIKAKNKAFETAYYEIGFLVEE